MSSAATRFAPLLTVVALLSCNDDSTPTQPAGAPAPAAPEFALAPNSWGDRARLPVARYFTAAGVAYNSARQPVVYLLSGYAAGPTGQNDRQTFTVDAYNYSTDTWETKRAKGGRPSSNGIGVIGGKLYQAGGLLENGKPTGALVVYDPVRDTFTTRAPMPSRSMVGVTGVIAGKLYVLTGYSADCTCVITKRLYRYDPATNAWTTLRSPPNAHVDGVAGVINGKLYVVGGGDPTTNGYHARLDVYNPATDSWKTLAPAPAALTEPAGAVLQNQLYFIGAGGTFAYDPVTNQWLTKAPTHSARTAMAAASVVSLAGPERILAMGGTDAEGGWASRENEVYVP